MVDFKRKLEVNRLVANAVEVIDRVYISDPEASIITLSDYLRDKVTDLEVARGIIRIYAERQWKESNHDVR